ncbi:MAG: type II secretion system protein GspD, partial [Tepidisphaeraceae bacterium]
SGGGGGGGRGGGGGGGGGGLFGGDGGGDDEEDEVDREELVEQITTLIIETIAPDSWRDSGGSVGSLRELSGQLIVTQTPENHRELQGLLGQLRETRAIQVTVEARFLTVQRNFLEDVGFDMDFLFNIDGNISNRIGGLDLGGNVIPGSPIGVNQNTSTFTLNPTTGLPGSIGSNPASNLSGLNVSGGFLDDFQVTFLLRATQANQTSTLLTAPRVTLFNGQRAYVVVATETAYVSDLTPVVAEGFGLFDPEVDILQSGVSLDVQATVSADRKYVTLTLRPTLSTLIALIPFSISNVIPGAIPGTGGVGVSTAPSISSGIIQQPILQITEVQTTVSVPDGGTILLGGQTLAGEIEKEAGTPVLSKIPFLKRLFTNRSMAKDEQVLLILVKPTIIIQREIEQKQFPLLSTKVGS